MQENKLLPNLFRTEYSKIVAVLCRTFGIENIQLAEDIVSETFLKASETWGLKGIPKDPTAWMYAVAKNRALDHFRRKKNYDTKVVEQYKLQNPSSDEMHIDFSETNMNDSLLQMMFSVCDPSIPSESQLALALRVLCGFGIEEIASALMSNKSAINKKLLRAKEKLRKTDFDTVLPSEKEIQKRLSSVLSILYLLFNEGYYSSVTAEKVRKDLCYEAMRLLHVLIDNKNTDLAKPNALMALFCFHASRFEARTDQQGEQVLYQDQDTDKWNNALIKKGEYFLNRSKNEAPSRFHYEAMIAFWHTRRSNDDTRKWENILQVYNRLLQIEYSPVAALNRTYALAQVHGKADALKEALKIDLKGNHLYHSLLAELYPDEEKGKKEEHLKIALKLAKSENDKKLIRKKINQLSG